MVAPITSSDNNKNDLPTHVEIKEKLKNDSIILTEQIRSIDKTRLKEFKGRVNRKTELKIDEALIVAFGINIEKITDKMIYF